MVGLSRDAALTTLANAGLDPHAFDVASSKPTGHGDGAGSACRQAWSRRAAACASTSRSGPASVTVPSVIGLPFDQANQALQNQGFSVSRRDVDSDQAKGIVVDQSPSGTRAEGLDDHSSASRRARRTSTVPDVTSQDEDSARSTLESAGFKVTVQRQDVTDPGLDGIVLGQDPTPDASAPQGSTVTIVVGRFKATEPPPPATP